MASEGTGQMLVLRVTMWSVRLRLKVMLIMACKSQLLEQPVGVVFPDFLPLASDGSSSS